MRGSTQCQRAWSQDSANAERVGANDEWRDRCAVGQCHNADNTDAQARTYIRTHTQRTRETATETCAHALRHRFPTMHHYGQ